LRIWVQSKGGAARRRRATRHSVGTRLGTIDLLVVGTADPSVRDHGGTVNFHRHEGRGCNAKRPEGRSR
jgi:hypothetical protein